MEKRKEKGGLYEPPFFMEKSEYCMKIRLYGYVGAQEVLPEAHGRCKK
jgi:hypothetical protein